MKGFAFHVHHGALVEWCFDLDERIAFIKGCKPKGEQELRLRLLKIIPKDRLPKGLLEVVEARDKAWEAYNKAGRALDKAMKVYGKAEEAYNKAWEAYNKAGKALNKAGKACGKAIKTLMPELIQLHEELCPDCPWNGKTIFPEVK